MIRNSMVNNIIHYEDNIISNLIIDCLDTLIVNITQLLLLILLFALFIIINAFVRINYTYI
jgi:hypothetical protein